MENVRSKTQNDSCRLKLRKQCLFWALKTLKSLNVRLRTKEMICLMIDAVLAEKNYSVADPQSLCIACILFSLKLETDFPPEFPSFMRSVRLSLRVSREKLLQLEREILVLLPDYFCRLPVISEWKGALLARMNICETASTEAALEEALLERYIEKGPRWNFSRLFTKPIMDAYFPIREAEGSSGDLTPEEGSANTRRNSGCSQDPSVVSTGHKLCFTQPH